MPALTRELLAARLAWGDEDTHGERPLLRLHIGPADAHRTVTYGELARRARHARAAFDRRGARPGDRIAILMPHSLLLVTSFFGAIHGGLVPSIVAWPTAKMDPEKYRKNLHAVVSRLGARFVLTDARMAGELGASLGTATVLDATELDGELDGGAAAVPRRDDEPLFIQFSGGTTGTQKSVPITLAKLQCQLAAFDERLALTAEDRVISWLPLYHDMGLVACLLLPFAFRLSVSMFAPMEWVLDPTRLLEAVGTDRATLCWLPNFAFNFMAKRARLPLDADLSPLRAVINCSEPVREESLRAFRERFSSNGLRPTALHTSYAMAEATFAVTQTRQGDPPRTLRVTRAGLGRGRIEPSEHGERTLVSCGAPLRDVEVRLALGTAEGAIGELELRGPFVMDDYLPSEARTPRWAFSNDGWYRTGDLGFLYEGHVYVTGRKKDVVIVGGVNVFPEDIELAVGELDGIHAGRVVAMGVEDAALGTERLVVVAEVNADADLERSDALEAAIRKEVVTVAGVAAGHVFVVPQRWIVKSTAGKISRSETRERVLKRWESLEAREFE